MDDEELEAAIKEANNVLEEAIRAKFKLTNPNVYITEWFVATNGAVAENDDVSQYNHIASNTPLHSLLGLCEYYSTIFKARIATHIFKEE